jgi:hypothetical protein
MPTARLITEQSAASCASAASENRAKDVAQVNALETEPSIAGPTACAKRVAQWAHLTSLIITGALIFVANHVVRGGNLFESFFGRIIAGIGIGGILASELAVRLGDISLGCVLRNAKHCVVVSIEPLTLDVI